MDHNEEDNQFIDQHNSIIHDEVPQREKGLGTWAFKLAVIVNLSMLLTFGLVYAVALDGKQGGCPNWQGLIAVLIGGAISLVLLVVSAVAFLLGLIAFLKNECEQGFAFLAMVFAFIPFVVMIILLGTMIS